VASIKHVLFDMDGVLSAYDFPRRLEVLSAHTGVPAAEIEAKIFTSGFDDRADEGAFDADDYLAEFGRLLGVPVSAEVWLEARAGGMTTDLEMIELARAVADRASIAMLTNNGPLLQPHLPSIAPAIAATFGDRAFFSYQFGVGKTDPEVFRLVLDQIGAVAESTLFIDDTPEYLENARTSGLATHLFEGIDGLREELERRDLL
jgi:putative hydrolase of the HAD superfamily